MSYTLSEQEKSLLSAFHDGEATPIEGAQARQLLERSPEARAWLHDARSVRNMSMEAAMRTPLPPLSGKLTGSAIVTAATRQGALSGGGFFAAARSPFGLAGAAALFLAGAVWTFQELKNPDPVPSLQKTELAVAAPEGNFAEAGNMAIRSVQPDENALMIPPITARDLAGFALEGALPINTERTKFVGMGADDAQEATLVREIEGEMRTLEPLQVRALDSLAELLRSSVVRLQRNGVAVRSDLPDLRMAVIEQLQKGRLSGTARRELNVARQKAQENRTQLFTSLEAEMRKMEAGLLAAGETPYVFIESSETIESPAGDRNSRAIVEVIGKRSRIITLNPHTIRIADPNPRLDAALAVAAPSRKGRPAITAGSGTVTEAPAAKHETATAPPAEAEWQWIAVEPFMQSVTISIFSNAGMSVIISDEADTTWQSETLYIRSDIYPLSARINALTERLNEQLSRIANDRAKPPEVRAWEIVRKQNIYTRQLQQLLDSANNSGTEQAPNETPTNDDTQKRENDPLKDAAEHDASEQEKRPLESTCMPWEDCTGVG